MPEQPDRQAMEWVPPEPHGLGRREVSPGMTMRELLEHVGPLAQSRVIEAGKVPGEPTTYRALDVEDWVPWRPVEWPWLRIDEMVSAAYRRGHRIVHASVDTLDLAQVHAAGL